jgi:hypothetical protein
MAQELVAYQADSSHPRDIVDVALSVLLKVDINAFVDLKEKYLPHGLKQAIRQSNHVFWQDTGLRMWEEIRTIINSRIESAYYFGQHEEENWDHERDGHCETLPAYRDDQANSTSSFWLPSPEDLAKLNAGQPICLTIYGRTHPVVSVHLEHTVMKEHITRVIE